MSNHFKLLNDTLIAPTGKSPSKLTRSNSDPNLQVGAGSSSKSVPTDDLIVKVEKTVKKLKTVSSKKYLATGSLLASFLSAHNLLEACTAELSSSGGSDHEPFLSPTKITASTTNSNLNSQAVPITPDPEARGKKTVRSISPDNSEPEAKRARFDNVEGSSSGSSLTVPLDDLTVKVNEMVNMLKSEGCGYNLVSGPLLGCFVSAHTLLVACTTQLLSISTRKAKALDHQGSEVFNNYSSTTTNETAADGSGEKNYD